MKTSTLKLQFRRRPKSDLSIAACHERLMSELSRLEKPWKAKEGVVTPSLDDGEVLVALKTSDLLTGEFPGLLSYQFRDISYLKDKGKYDDVLDFEIDRSPDLYKSLVDGVFEKYVRAFGAYRGTLIGSSLAKKDATSVLANMRSSGKDINGRDGVYRINALNFFDSELCGRAFGLTPEQMENLLKGAVEKIVLTNDGIFIFSSLDLPDDSDLEAINQRLRMKLS